MPITTEAAHAMGAKGAAPTEAERLLFEAWMRGHCWALSATWDGKQYKSDAEQGGDLDPRAIQTRRLWAAWRDRAALAKREPLPEDAMRRTVVLVPLYNDDTEYAYHIRIGRAVEAAHQIPMPIQVQHVPSDDTEGGAP